MVVVSDRELEMVSFPVEDHVKPYVALLNKALHAQATMIGECAIVRK